jgi:hypothetical protein
MSMGSLRTSMETPSFVAITVRTALVVALHQAKHAQMSDLIYSILILFYVLGSVLYISNMKS